MFLYNLGVSTYGLLIACAALTNEKARQWLSGRKNWRRFLQIKIDALQSNNRVWVHCASYGEFEQGRPLIDGIRERNPEKKIILTFFSPSGYEAFKNYNGVDLVFYLPLDTPSNARDFVEILKPTSVIFIKYEFWINVLNELRKRKLPVYLVSATFKAHHPFFKWYGSVFRKSLSSFTKLFVQDQNSLNLLNAIGITNHEVCGDTRFDRVIQIKENLTQVSGISQFKGNHKLLIAGSTWPKDEALLCAALKKLSLDKLKIIIAPHNVDHTYLNQTIDAIKTAGLSFSLFSKGVDIDARVLIIDSIGLLSKIYYHGDCAYVGGGFNGGLHSTLEPAVFGLPVIFYGPHFVKYNEAVEIINIDAGTNVNNSDELAAALKKYLENNELNIAVKKRLAIFFEKNANATNRILNAIKI